MFNLKKNVWFAVIEFIINIGLVFASYRLVIMQGGIEALGLWTILFAWTSLIRIGDAGMANATVRFVAMLNLKTQKNKIQNYIETAILTNIGLFIILSFGGFFILNANLDLLVNEQNIDQARSVLPVMFASFFLLNISGVVLSSIVGLHLSYVRSQISVGGNILQLILVFFLVPTYGLFGLALSQIVQYGVMLIIGWVIVRRISGISNIVPLGFKFLAFKEMLSFSLKAQIANISNGLFEPISKILVSHFGGLQVLGLYELAFKSVWLPRNAAVAGTTATLPTLTAMFKRKSSEMLGVYKKAVRYTSLSVGVLMVCVALASPVISYLWIGEIVWQYSAFIIILMVGVLFNSFGAAAYNLATVTGYMRNNIIVNLSVLAILIMGGVLAGLALPIYGLVFLIAVAMGLGGVWIKILNERLLP